MHRDNRSREEWFPGNHCEAAHVSLTRKSFSDTQVATPLRNGGTIDGLESGGRKLEAGQGEGERELGQLTDDDLNVINGRRDQLEGKIQERYGLAKDQVRKDIDDWYAAQRW